MFLVSAFLEKKKRWLIIAPSDFFAHRKIVRATRRRVFHEAAQGSWKISSSAEKLFVSLRFDKSHVRNHADCLFLLPLSRYILTCIVVIFHIDACESSRNSNGKKMVVSRKKNGVHKAIDQRTTFVELLSQEVYGAGATTATR